MQFLSYARSLVIYDIMIQLYMCMSMSLCVYVRARACLYLHILMSDKLVVLSMYTMIITQYLYWKMLCHFSVTHRSD